MDNRNWGVGEVDRAIADAHTDDDDVLQAKLMLVGVEVYSCPIKYDDTHDWHGFKDRNCRVFKYKNRRRALIAACFDNGIPIRN